jgi:hypothetical protein
MRVRKRATSGGVVGRTPAVGLHIPSWARLPVTTTRSPCTVATVAAKVTFTVVVAVGVGVALVLVGAPCQVSCRTCVSAVSDVVADRFGSLSHENEPSASCFTYLY